MNPILRYSISELGALMSCSYLEQRGTENCVLLKPCKVWLPLHSTAPFGHNPAPPGPGSRDPNRPKSASSEPGLGLTQLLPDSSKYSNWRPGLGYSEKLTPGTEWTARADGIERASLGAAGEPDCATPELLGGRDAGTEPSLRFRQMIGFVARGQTKNNRKVAYHFRGLKCTQCIFMNPNSSKDGFKARL